MDALRLLQQRALRQVFQSRLRPTRHMTREVSSASAIGPQLCLRRKLREPAAFPNTFKSSSHASFPSARLPKPPRRFQSSSTQASSSSSSSTSTESLTLSQRMRKLSREYGYASLGVYLALTALDLPFCYLAVSYLGTERIGRWEHAITSYVTGWISWRAESHTKEDVAAGTVAAVEDATGAKGERRLLEEEATSIAVEDQHGYKEAEKANRGENASFWTKLALAYAIHKSFIFIRVPLTAAITPKVVKTLRSWGWNIGKRPAALTTGQGKGLGINTGKTGVKAGKE